MKNNQFSPNFELYNSKSDNKNISYKTYLASLSIFISIFLSFNLLAADNSTNLKNQLIEENISSAIPAVEEDQFERLNSIPKFDLFTFDNNLIKELNINSGLSRNNNKVLLKPTIDLSDFIYSDEYNESFDLISFDNTLIEELDNESCKEDFSIISKNNNQNCSKTYKFQHNNTCLIISDNIESEFDIEINLIIKNLKLSLNQIIDDLIN